MSPAEGQERGPERPDRVPPSARPGPFACRPEPQSPTEASHPKRRLQVKTRTGPMRILLGLVFLGALALGATPALAAHNDGVFQIDGDARAATCGGSFPGTIGCTGDDWDKLYTCPADGVLGCTKATPGVGNSATQISDLVVDLSPSSIFTGGGSKDQLDITQWNWKDGSVPDKDDLVEAFAALYAPTSGSRAGHRIIYFGANRLAVNGDAQIGFWFLQNAVSLKSDGTFQDALGNPAHHKVGDVLILSNFVNGGGTSNIQVFVVMSVNSDDSVTLTQLINNTAGANGVCDPNNSDRDLQGKSVAPGTAIHDLAIVTGTSGFPLPTGNVTFQLFGTTNCTGAFTSETVLLTVGSTDSRANSTSFIPAPGSLSYQAIYNGDANYPNAITSTCEPLTVNKFQSSIATHILNATTGAEVTDSLIDLGSAATVAVRDQAIVTKNPVGGGPTPTGTVTFQVFDSGNCAGTPASTQTVSLVGGTCSGNPCGVALSSVINLDANTLSYRATYSGDANFLPSSVSRCEPVCAIDTTK